MKTYHRETDWGGVMVFAMIGLLLTFFAAFIRHAWWIISMMMSGEATTAGKLALAILGIVFPPIGVLHGFWLWMH